MRVFNLRGGPRLVAAGSSVLLAASGLMLTSIVSAAPASASVGQVAPYVDMSNSQEGVLNTVISSDGLRSFTAAFAIGEGCSDIWGDTLPIGSDPTIGGEISSAKAAGASVIVSSGGSAGEPISFTCTSQSTIDAAYQAIINDYGTDYLDFDIEGAAIADTTGIDQTFQAMKDLKASNPGLVWSVTVPVLPSGLDNYGTALLQDAQNMGVTIPVVNVMAMDYYQGDIEMGNAAISAAENTLSQMRAVNGSYSYANVGITPMIGVNDDGSTFTLADASSVASWASSNGIGRLAFWSVDRDQACPGGNGGAASPTCSGVSESTGQFTHAFTGGGGGTTPPPTEAPYGGTPAAIPGTVQAANYDTGGQGVAYNVASVNGTANSYRSDGVDLEACTDTGCGDDIGWTASGQWFKYTVNVATAGTYAVSLRLASPSGVTDGLHVASSSGANLSGNINVPATGGWQTWATVTATVTLPAGQQTLTIDQDNGGWNIHQLTFASSTTPPGDTVTVSSPGNQTGTVGTAASLQVSGTDSASGQTLTFSATGLPAGLSISSSGLVSGTPTTAATSNVTVTATDTTGAKGSASFTWTIGSTAPPPSALVNGGFETGSLSPWVCQAGDAVVTAPVHSGTHAGMISPTSSQTGECDQTITLSPNTTYTLTGWTQGNYAYIGVSGGATASTWTSSSGWTQQTVSFTTGSSGTVTVFVHGWY
ncbi:MAG TPA: carbohydrate-binding protein, partial [Trebonia sp.]|nr:carbohydrate-binding protein [Trebonia sp.]